MTIDLDVHLARIVAGDAHAYGAFLAAAEPAVRRSLRPFAARVDVEAILQEAFLRLWRVAARFEPDGRPYGLLRLGARIAKNLAVDETRRRREQAAGDDADVTVEPSPPDPLLREHIVRCFAALPAQPAAAMRARVDAGGGEADALLAERLGMRPNTFFQNVARARELLAACLEKSGVSLALIAGANPEAGR